MTTTMMMMLTMKQDPATECETSGTPYVYTIILTESTPAWNQIQRREKRKPGTIPLLQTRKVVKDPNMYVTLLPCIPT